MLLDTEELVAIAVIASVLVASFVIITQSLNKTSIQTVNIQLLHDSEEGFDGPSDLPEGGGYFAHALGDNESVVANWVLRFPLNSTQYYNTLSLSWHSSFTLDNRDYAWQENLSIVLSPANYSKFWHTGFVSGQPGPAPILTDDFNITYVSPIDQRQRVELLWHYNLTVCEGNLTNFLCSLALDLILRQESGGLSIWEARIWTAAITIGCLLPTAEIIRRHVERGSD
ncbi:hypothetical protein EU537_01635 [Candidatus Thorarchaeota archaeon]|nr:MAG: hypothetical protein EU537_01635 [Candidatus Thorarchaeota archaeon]